MEIDGAVAMVVAFKAVRLIKKVFQQFRKDRFIIQHDQAAY